MKDDSVSINTYASKNVCVIETSSKMASTLSQKMVNHFLPKAQNFVDFVPYDFVKISQACCPISYQIMRGETLEFQCQRK